MQNKIPDNRFYMMNCIKRSVQKSYVRGHAPKGQKSLKLLISQEFYFFSVSLQVCIIFYKKGRLGGVFC